MISNELLEKDILTTAIIGFKISNTRMVVDNLTEDDFYNHAHKDIYNAIKECLIEQDSVAFEMLDRFLKTDNAKNVLQALIIHRSFDNLEPMIDKLKTVTKARRLAEASSGVIRDLTASDDLSITIDEIETTLYNIFKQSIGGNKWINFDKQYISEYLKEFKEKIEFNKQPGLPMGMPSVTRVTGGARGGELITIAGRPSMGKALSNSTLIPIPSGGFIKMGDIKIGDSVIGSDGNSTKVTNVWPQGKKRLYKVLFDDGREVLSDLEHNWLVRKRADAKEIIMTTNELIEYFKSDVYLREKRKPSIPASPITNYKRKKVPVDPWLLGALLGDGCLPRMSFTNSEEDVIEKVRSKVNRLTYGSKYSYNIADVKLRNQLRQLNLYGALSWDKFIPKVYLFNDKETRLEILKGLLDTDGYVEKRNSFIEYITVSKQLSEDVKFLVRSLGGRVSCVIKKTHYTKDNDRVLCRDAYRMRISFPNGLYPVSSKKHLEKYTGNFRRKRVYIKSIEKAHAEQATCISVAAEDKLFLCNDFIVTHNSSYALTCIVNQLIKGFKPAIFSLEMGKTQITNKLFSMVSDVLQKNIKYYHLRNPFGQKHVLQNMAQVIHSEILSSGNLNLNTDSGITFNEIKSYARELKHQGRLDSLFIDQLGLLVQDRNKERIELTQYTTGFKKLATELDIPIFQISQLSREAVDKPTLATLKSSGSIEEDSDIVIFPWRPHAVDPNHPDPTEVELIIAKARDSDTGKVNGYFSNETTFFREKSKNGDLLDFEGNRIDGLEQEDMF